MEKNKKLNKKIRGLSFGKLPHCLHVRNFYLEANPLVISTNSALLFVFFMLALMFYLFPIEKFVKQQSVPWHTISILTCIVAVPILLFIRNVPYYTIIISIGTFVISLIVYFNCFFLFYLYFSTGIKSPEGSPMRKAGFMIAIGLLLIVALVILSVGIFVMNPQSMKTPEVKYITIFNVIGEISFGVAGILVFNYGFYLIKPN